MRRRLSWGVNNTVGTTVAAGATMLFTLLSEVIAASEGQAGLTVMRTHLLIYPDHSEGAWDVGLIVGRSTDTGLTLSPAQNPGLSWMLLTSFPGTWSGATPDAIATKEYDVRAKRKMPNFEDTYLLVVTNTGTATHNWRHFCRTLVAHP
jgi:hypothetical protein